MNEGFFATPMATVALLGWVGVTIGLYCLMTPRRAMIASFVIGWLFLPPAVAVKFAPGIPVWDKTAAISIMALICTAAFDSSRLTQFRFRWFDIPVLLYSLIPFVSSVSVGDGAYEGICVAFRAAIVWWAPYYLGRIYFTDLESLLDLAMGLVLGGVAYAPLCLLEARISPQLNVFVYGYHQHDFAQTYRLGGWRPMVFMQHGLALGMFLTQVALTAVWLVVSGYRRTIWNMSMPLIAALLVFTEVMCRSSLAIVLLGVGLLVLYCGRLFGTRLLLVVLLLIPPAYVITRGGGEYDAHALVDLISKYWEPDRAVSLSLRIKNENLLIEHAMEHPAFGWGYNGTFLVKGEGGRVLSVPDGYWVIVLGENGVVGLVIMIAMMLTPAVLMLIRFPPRSWAHPAVAPAVALGVITVLHLIDCLMNAMMSPLFVLPMGALGSVYAATRPAVRSPLVGMAPAQPLPA